MPLKIRHQVAATVKLDCESVEPPPVCSLRHTTHVVWREMPAREAAREAQGTPLPVPVARVPPPGSYPLAEREPFQKLSQDSMFGKVPASH